MSGPLSGNCVTCGTPIKLYDSFAKKADELLCFDCFWSDVHGNDRQMDGLTHACVGGPYDGFAYWTDG